MTWTKDQMIAAILKLQRKTNENETGLNEIYPKLLRMQTDITRAEKRNEETLAKVNEVREMVISKENLSQESFRQELTYCTKEVNSCKEQLLLQREILLELEIKYFENEKAYKAKFEQQNNILKEQEKENECKFDEMHSEISDNYVNLQKIQVKLLNEIDTLKSLASTKQDKLKNICESQYKFDDIQKQISIMQEQLKEINKLKSQTTTNDQLQKANQVILKQHKNELLYCKSHIFNFVNGQNILNGMSQLHLACEYFLSDVAIDLVCKGTDINKFNDNQMTPLHLACKYGLNDVALELLNNGANINVQGKEGMTPIHLACKNDFFSEAYTQLNIGCNIVKINDDNHHWAIKNDYIYVVQQLIRQGADTNCKNNASWTPLLFAAHGGYVDVFNLLLKHRADINCSTDMGYNVLHLAAQGGHTSIVTKLINLGLDVNCKNKYGVTPLHFAVNGNHLSVVIELLGHGANVDAKAANDFTPLHMAALRGHGLVIGKLFEYGANIDAKTKDKYSPLHFAAYNGHTAALIELLNNGADTSCKTKRGSTVMDLAIEIDNKNIINILEEYPSPKNLLITVNGPVSY